MGRTFSLPSMSAEGYADNCDRGLHGPAPHRPQSAAIAVTGVGTRRYRRSTKGPDPHPDLEKPVRGARARADGAKRSEKAFPRR